MLWRKSFPTTDKMEQEKVKFPFETVFNTAIHLPLPYQHHSTILLPRCQTWLKWSTLYKAHHLVLNPLSSAGHTKADCSFSTDPLLSRDPTISKKWEEPQGLRVSSPTFSKNCTEVTCADHFPQVSGYQTTDCAPSWVNNLSKHSLYM